MNTLKTLVCALTLGAVTMVATAPAQAAGDAAAGKAFYEKVYSGNDYAQSAGVNADFFHQPEIPAFEKLRAA